MSSKFIAFMTSLSIIYPGVSLWVADGKLCSDYYGDDKEVFLETMSRLIMEFCNDN